MQKTPKAELKQLLPCLIAFGIVFLVLPILMLTDGTDAAFRETLLTTIFPVTSYVICMAYGAVRGYDWYGALCAPAFFALSLVIYFDGEAAVYLLIYAAFAFIGLVVGGFIGRKNRRKR